MNKELNSTTVDNYKRATIVVEGSNKLDFQIEGKGPLILDGGQYRVMAMAASEMMGGNHASCWQDGTGNGEYIRVIKVKDLCKKQCTRIGKTLGEIKKKSKRIPLVERKAIKLPKMTLLRSTIPGLRSKKTWK